MGIGFHNKDLMSQNSLIINIYNVMSIIVRVEWSNPEENMWLRPIRGANPLKKGDDATSHKQREKNGDIGPFIDLIHVSN